MVPGVLLSRFRREVCQPSPEQAALSVLISSRTFRAYIRPHFPCLKSIQKFFQSRNVFIGRLVGVATTGHGDKGFGFVGVFKQFFA